MKMALGLTIPQLSVSTHNFTEPDPEFDSYLYNTAPSVPLPVSSTGTPTSITTTMHQTVAGSTTATNPNDSNAEHVVNNASDDTVSGQTIQTSQVIKGLICFLSQESSQPLWNYEDITAKGIEFESKLFIIV